MKASVVISYYKNLPNLELILLALNKQSAKGDFEAIVSEDDDVKVTTEFLDKIKPILSFPVIHITQPDDGFRKCKVLNKAIESTTTDFIIFLDGDCVPHRHLVREYIGARLEGRVLYGRRVMLSEKISQRLLEKKNLRILNFINLILSGCKRIEEGLYLRLIPQRLKRKKSGLLLGCNMALSKRDLIAINGFDEDYTAPGGGEDSDIEWRLKAIGNISFYSMKFSAIVYHIYHQERFSKAMELKNEEILARKIQQGFFACKNGIRKLQ